MPKRELPLKAECTQRPGLLELARPELLRWLQERGHAALRAAQVQRWIVAGRAISFEQMTDLPRSLRAELSAAFGPLGSTIVRHLRSKDGTEKLLLKLADGQVIECVLMREEDRRTVCVSTQVGCGMGCVFCASGINGVV